MQIYVIIITEIRTEYENIFKGNVKNMKIIENRFEENMKKRDKFSHEIQICDPPV